LMSKVRRARHPAAQSGLPPGTRGRWA
jgi:hypothetical protein